MSVEILNELKKSDPYKRKPTLIVDGCASRNGLQVQRSFFAAATSAVQGVGIQPSAGFRRCCRAEEKMSTIHDINKGTVRKNTRGTKDLRRCEVASAICVETRAVAEDMRASAVAVAVSARTPSGS